MNFSLIIPCYNEARNIPILIKKYSKFIKTKNNELILVNNGSNDETDKIFKKLKKNKKIKTYKVKKNIGFGYGLKNVLKSIKIFLKEQKLEKKIFIKGNRVNKIKNYWSINDIIFSYGLTFFSTILFRKNLYDIHAQPVLFSKKMLKEIS